MSRTIVRISAIEHFAYCPRQCALIHTDGVWTDNRHTIRGRRAHRRADSGKSRQERGCQVLRAVPLWSERLGLSGRADVVEVQGDRVWPVEYKSGTRHGDAADLQVCAQALCLEEMLGVEIPHGYVWYGGPKRRERVTLSLELRERVLQVVDAIRSQMDTAILPEAPNDERCRECQLLNHCLPEITSAPDRVVKYLEEVVFACDT